jgi:hypothetical protein
MSAIIILAPAQSPMMVWHLYLLSCGKPLTDALDQHTPLTTVNEVVDEGPHFVYDASLFECYSSDFVFHAP